MVEVFSMILLALIGLAIGAVSTLIGVGGGFLIVPTLILLFESSPHTAIGTSLVVIIFTAVSASLAYGRQRGVDWKLGLIVAGLSVPGASLGAYATSLISSSNLKLVFGIVLAALSFRFILRESTIGKREELTKSMKTGRYSWKRTITDNRGQVFEYWVNPIAGAGFMFLAGFVSGFLGVGGGILYVPVFPKLWEFRCIQL